jgi:ATP-dependent exoDNAse (exonuclease V) beta subunit
MRFNRQQQEAIQTIDRNIALVAGAGTGKTAVLTERFITLLKKGTLPKNRALSSIAAITFTEKAADEMKKRIQDRLQTEQTHLPLRGQHDFRISTIHGFCARILRDDPAGAGVDPLFTVLEEAEAQKMLTGAMTEAYARLVIDADEGMLIRHAWHAHNAFLSDAVQLYHRLRAGAADRERVHKNSTAYPGYAKERDSCLKDKLLQYLKTAGKNQKLYKFLTENGGETEITQSKESRLKLVSLLVQADPFGTAKGVAEIKDMVYHCAADSETEFKQAGDFLFALLAEADRIYTADKKRKAGLDYDDLQEKALCRLRDPEALRAWQDEIRYLMVDECQDINDMQKEIFYALCTKEKPLDRNNLFVVGDPRQSIYGFRYARAELFEQLQKDVTDSGGAVLSMSTNYRCSPEIISYVNGVFRPYFPKLEELQAGGDAKHVCIEWCAGEDKESITPEAVIKVANRMPTASYKTPSAIFPNPIENIMIDITRDVFSKLNPSACKCGEVLVIRSVRLAFISTMPIMIRTKTSRPKGCGSGRITSVKESVPSFAVPYGVKPKSAGSFANTKNVHIPTTRNIASAKRRFTIRQPHTGISQPATGLKSIPPMADPSKAKPIAVPVFAANQRLTIMVTGMKPAIPINIICKVERI